MAKRTDPQTRLEAARAARQLLAKDIDFGQFLREFPDDVIDDDIDELLDQMEHEPKVGGLLGVSEETHRGYIRKTVALIERLEKS